MSMYYVYKEERESSYCSGKQLGTGGFLLTTCIFLLPLLGASCHVMSVIIRADKVPVYSLAAASHINVWSLSDQAAIMY